MRIRIRKVAEPEEMDDDVRELIEDLDSLALSSPYRSHNTYWWIAYDGKVIAGYAGLEIYQEREVAFLCRCGVIASHRGNGIQRRLIRVRERQARIEGMKRCVTYTSPCNYPSANNLIRCGYRLYKPEYPYGVANALYFQKHLQGVS